MVRETIEGFCERLGRLSERERQALLTIFDEVVPKIEARPQADVERELAELRAARRSGGRRTPAETKRLVS